MNAVIIVYEIRVNYIKLAQWAWKQGALYEIMLNIWENIMKYNSLQAKLAKKNKPFHRLVLGGKFRDHGYMPETSRHKTCLFVIFKEVNHLSSKSALRFYVCTSHNINSLVHGMCAEVIYYVSYCIWLSVFCAVVLIVLYFMSSVWPLCCSHATICWVLIVN